MTVAIPVVPSAGPAFYPHSAVNWIEELPRPPVGTLGLHFTALSGLETDSFPQGMHVHVSLFPGNRFQRAGVPELLLSSSGQPGRHQAPMNGERLLGPLPTLSTQHLGCASAFAWESRAQGKGQR